MEISKKYESIGEYLQVAKKSCFKVTCFSFELLSIIYSIFEIKITECCFFLFGIENINSMLRQQSFEVAEEEQNVLNYQGKKLLHTVRIQILDIENTLHYIQKKHSIAQLKEAFSQIYNALNEMEPLFRVLRANFVHQQIKKIVNCFGIIYVILLDNIEKNRKGPNSKQTQAETMQSPSKIQSSAIPHGESEPPSDLKAARRPLGGVHLYNEQYRRNLQLGSSWKQRPKNKCQGELSKQQFRTMVMEELGEAVNVSSPDQILDIFSFKFKHGKEKEVVTFHDELLSISNFFKQAQNQAFQFLSKTKDQSNFIKYNDSFSDILTKVAEEKDKKIQIFSAKITQVFSSMRGKTQQTVAQMQKKLIKAEQSSKIAIQTETKQTQTIYNIEQQLKSYKKRLCDSQQRYRLIMQFKKKQIQQAAKLQLQLQNQLNLKNRQIVYLKLSLQQDKMVISNLNRKMKQLGEINKRRDVRSNQQPSINIQLVENHSEIDKIICQCAQDEAALEFLRKQKRTAKKVLLEQRKSVMIEDKSAFSKRYTQQLQPQNPNNNFAFGKNLSEISQGDDSEFNQSQQPSIMFSKSSNAHPTRRPKKLNSNLLHVSVSESQGSFQQLSRKQLKTKKSLGSIRGLQLIPSLGGSRNSLFDDDLSSDRNSSASIDEQDYQRIQMLFQRQSKKTNQILAKKRNSGISNSLPKPKSIFSQGKQNQINKNRPLPKQKLSFSSTHSRQSHQRSQINSQSSQNGAKQSKGIQLKTLETDVSVPEMMLQILSKKRSNLVLSSAQIHECINSGKRTVEQSIQTSCKQIIEQESIENESAKPSNKSFKTLNSAHQKPKEDPSVKPIPKRISTQKKITEQQQLFTRSATQSKFFSKGRQLKAYYSSALKNNQKYLTKNTEKSLEEDTFKNSNSCIEMHQGLFNEVQKSLASNPVPIHEQMEQKEQEIEREARKLAVKCKNLQQFKAKFTEIHRPICGGSCKHLQKFAQNFIKYRQQSKPRIRMAVKIVNESIHSGPEQDPSRLPSLDLKKGHN